MEDARADYILSLAEDDRVRLRRQQRAFMALACVLPVAGLVAVVISLWRLSHG